jgi:addiction module HigA family antidote
MKSLRNPNRRPTHPGAILREDILPALKMTQTELAERLDVSRLTVSEILHEKRGLSPEMAVRIGLLLATSPESWLRMQEAVDLWEVQQGTAKLALVKPLEKSRLALCGA